MHDAATDDDKEDGRYCKNENDYLTEKMVDQFWALVALPLSNLSNIRLLFLSINCEISVNS